MRGIAVGEELERTSRGGLLTDEQEGVGGGGLATKKGLLEGKKMVGVTQSSGVLRSETLGRTIFISDIYLLQEN
ncbi:hypothetical protein E2562_027667 [Oryza meyeriana var. granulata]|uniref:Uncharacterized protein n=1 Tax=Oryza meyeriana var. granulata TaxID=110450 RepID=A0A6G1EQC4_9ORYZ|nr:hypothetical protein E2562_027667 [Oryza meyeriana var. granulata]